MTHLSPSCHKHPTRGRSSLRQITASSLTCALSVALPLTAMGQDGSAEPKTNTPTVSTLLDAITVQSSGLASNIPRTSFASTKTDTLIAETPQSVSVVTRKQLDEQQPQSVSEALNYTPGVFTNLVGATNRYDYVALRGFVEGSTDNTVLDGLKVLSDTGTYSSMQIDPFFLERIDVFRGPSSVLFGRTAPGGVVGLTSKRPLFEPHRKLEFRLGTNNRMEGGFDLTGPVNDEGTAAWRVVGMGRSLDSQLDHAKESRYAIMPSLQLNLSDKTSLLLQGYFQRDPNGGYHSGIPADASITTDHDGNKLSRHFFDGDTTYDRFKREQNMLGYLLEHAFNDRWIVRQNARYTQSNLELQQVYQTGWANQRELSRAYSGADESSRSFAIDNVLQGQFDTGALSHTLLIGADYQRRHVTGTWDYMPVSNLDVYAPVYGNATFLAPNYQTDVDRTLRQQGIYVQDQISYENWRFLLSGRWDQADVSNSSYGTTSEWDGSHFSMRAGIVYLFDNGLSPYASYSESFNPNAYSDQQGNLLPPTTSRQYEVGLRYEPANSDAMYSASLFDLTQDDVATRAIGQSYHEASGAIRSRGLELEAMTAVNKDLTLHASYTLTDIEYTRDTDYEGKTPYQAPRHMASLWAAYQVTPGLSVNGGVRYVGTSWADKENTLKVPSYTLVDLGMKMDLGHYSPTLEGATLQVNAHNVFDKEYVASCVSLLYCYYGAERSVMATLSYNW
ncbi:TonB-dependent siderophore receptor [Pollutimonas harenae]|uniref:TonB-dependent siderophore receptor n=1 Tax=Pollutimonas harenae TaxID=657015 RepID=A0A853H3V6_9BURK|nr:TonB-dependent siderophore receptor [Pollutimonas harenae]NYT85885.1 TonB-dependent siderophore receptor [Pollutimonas harenae]